MREVASPRRLPDVVGSPCRPNSAEMSTTLNQTPGIRLQSELQTTDSLQEAASYTADGDNLEMMLHIICLVYYIPRVARKFEKAFFYEVYTRRIGRTVKAKCTKLVFLMLALMRDMFVCFLLRATCSNSLDLLQGVGVSE